MQTLLLSIIIDVCAHCLNVVVMLISHQLYNQPVSLHHWSQRVNEWSAAEESCLCVHGFPSCQDKPACHRTAHTCRGKTYIPEWPTLPPANALDLRGSLYLETVPLVHLFSCTGVFQWYHFTPHSRSRRHPGENFCVEKYFSRKLTSLVQCPASRMISASTCRTKLPPHRDWCTAILAFERSPICEYLKAVIGLGDSLFVPSIRRACVFTVHLSAI